MRSSTQRRGHGWVGEAVADGGALAVAGHQPDALEPLEVLRGVGEALRAGLGRDLLRVPASSVSH